MKVMICLIFSLFLSLSAEEFTGKVLVDGKDFYLLVDGGEKYLITGSSRSQAKKFDGQEVKLVVATIGNRKKGKLLKDIKSIHGLNEEPLAENSTKKKKLKQTKKKQAEEKQDQEKQAEEKISPELPENGSIEEDYDTDF